MRIIITILVAICVYVQASGQAAKSNLTVPDSTKKILEVEAACGECQFKMEGRGCDLAVRIGKKTYFVDGTGINDHGSAHADDGFCNTIRKAKVQGEIINKRFAVTYFELLKPKK